MARVLADREQILRLFGTIADIKIAAILDTGATTEELEEAAAWAAGESDVMGKERLPLAGRAAQVYDILTADRALNEDERP